MAVEATFTRESLAAYEKSTPAPVVETPATKNTAEDAATAAAGDDSASASDNADDAADSSTAADDGQQSDADDGTSEDVNADSSTADADSESETTEDEAETEEEGDEPEAVRPKSGSASERIRGLVAENKSLKAYAQEVLNQAKEEIARVAREAAPAATTTKKPDSPAPTASADDPRPTLEGCDFDPVRLDKEQGEWLERQLEKRVENALNNHLARQTEEQIKSDFAKGLEALRETTPDFDKIMARNMPPGVTRDSANALLRAKEGPKVTVYLAQNPTVAAAWAKMSAADQLVELGRLKTVVTAAKPATEGAAKPPVKKKIPTKAPPPPRTTSAGTTTAKKNLLDGSLSMQDWVAAERAEKAERQANRIKVRDSMRRR